MEECTRQCPALCKIYSNLFFFFFHFKVWPFFFTHSSLLINSFFSPSPYVLATLCSSQLPRKAPWLLATFTGTFCTLCMKGAHCLFGDIPIILFIQHILLSTPRVGQAVMNQKWRRQGLSLTWELYYTCAIYLESSGLWKCTDVQPLHSCEWQCGFPQSTRIFPVLIILNERRALKGDWWGTFRGGSRPGETKTRQPEEEEEVTSNATAMERSSKKRN